MKLDRTKKQDRKCQLDSCLNSQQRLEYIERLERERSILWDALYKITLEDELHEILGIAHDAMRRYYIGQGIDYGDIKKV